MVKYPHYIQKIALRMADQIFVLAVMEAFSDVKCALVSHLKQSINMCVSIVSNRMTMMENVDKWSLQFQNVRMPRRGEPWIDVKSTITVGL
jgi:hypothetical protein